MTLQDHQFRPGDEANGFRLAADGLTWEPIHQPSGQKQPSTTTALWIAAVAAIAAVAVTAIAVLGAAAGSGSSSAVGGSQPGAGSEIAALDPDARFPDGSIADWSGGLYNREGAKTTWYYSTSVSIFEENRSWICPMVRDDGPGTVHTAVFDMFGAAPMTQAALDASFIALDVSVMAVDHCPDAYVNVR